MTYKVITTKEKISLEAPLPTFDQPILPVLKETKERWTLDNITKLIYEILYRYKQLPFLRYRLFTLALLLGASTVLPGFLTGLMFGLYFSLIAFLFICVSEPIQQDQNHPVEEIVEKVKELSAEEVAVNKVYKGTTKANQILLKHLFFRMDEHFK